MSPPSNSGHLNQRDSSGAKTLALPVTDPSLTLLQSPVPPMVSPNIEPGIALGTSRITPTPSWSFLNADFIFFEEGI